MIRWRLVYETVRGRRMVEAWESVDGRFRITRLDDPNQGDRQAGYNWSQYTLWERTGSGDWTPVELGYRLSGAKRRAEGIAARHPLPGRERSRELRRAGAR